jgi:predicted phosphodiesterase
MRLLILSDLHREIYPNRDLGIDLSVSKPDVIILAGDIDKGPRSIQWASDLFAGLPVLYVAGNHEFYGSDIDRVPDKIKDACTDTPNVRFLDQGEFIYLFPEPVRFLGATMWTDFALFGIPRRPIAMAACAEKMNDYHAIRVAKDGYRKLRPNDTLALHNSTRRWMETKLPETFTGKTVIITHHAPAMWSVPDEYTSDIVSSAYASDLEDIALRADLWIHGHTHTSMDYQIDQCRVVCNPCGYVMRGGGNENPDFNPNFIVEI